ncbi:MAG: PD40 domain-containing protein [Nitrospirae bacterium]|nr:PD40 domain-containing protein [Nitrospirota bacterium]
MKTLVRLLASVFVAATASWADSISISNIREFARGEYMAASWSPDAQQIAFSGFKYRGLFVAPLAGGTLSQLTSDPWAGFRPIWSNDSRALITSFPGAGSEKLRAIDLQGNALHTIPTFRAPSRSGGTEVYAESDEIFIIQAKTPAIQITRGGDKFFAPMLSPDGSKVLYQGLASGLFVHEPASGRTLNLGRGNHPAFSPDSDLVFFDVSTDDGRNLLSADLFVQDLKKLGRIRLTFTKDRLEQRPAPSPDMKALVFDAEGVIYVGDLVSK